MASSIPTQSRAVDPYASYNSNVVNQLTGIVTRGADVLDYYNSLQVIPDSTSAIDHVVVPYLDLFGFGELCGPFIADYVEANNNCI